MKLFPLLVLLISTSAWAHSAPICDPSAGVTPSPEAIQAYDDYILGLEDDYQWLYEELIPPLKRSGTMDEPARKTFFRHLADTWEVFPPPREVWTSPLPAIKGSSRKITGKITYVGFVRLSYNYDLIPDGKGGLIIEVRVHFKNPVGHDLNYFGEHLKNASEIWNRHQVPLSFPYQFRFSVEPDSSRAHFSVNIQDSTRGPYNTNWSRTWQGPTIAHEVGHMMGLADEYKTLSGEIDCLEESLMCNSWWGSLWTHHYYLVLRRIFTEHP